MTFFRCLQIRLVVSSDRSRRLARQSSHIAWIAAGSLLARAVFLFDVGCGLGGLRASYCAFELVLRTGRMQRRWLNQW